MKLRLLALFPVLLPAFLSATTRAAWADSRLRGLQREVQASERSMRKYLGYYQRAAQEYRALYAKGVRPSDPRMRQLQKAKNANLTNYNYSKARYERAKAQLAAERRREAEPKARPGWRQPSRPRKTRPDPRPSVRQLEEHEAIRKLAVDAANEAREVFRLNRQIQALGKDFDRHVNARIDKFNPFKVFMQEAAFEALDAYVATGISSVGAFLTAYQLGEALGSTTAKFNHIQAKARDLEIRAAVTMKYLRLLDKRLVAYKTRYGEGGPAGAKSLRLEVQRILENGKRGVYQTAIRR